MTNHPFYLAFGMAVLSLVGMAEYRGWSLTSVNEVKNVPKTVRENPGVYRSVYRPYPHYTGGK
jgi:hypothetical protein